MWDCSEAAAIADMGTPAKVAWSSEAVHSAPTLARKGPSQACWVSWESCRTSE